MPELKQKQWCCKNNHILGYIHWNSNGLPQLMLLRQAVDMQELNPDQVDLLGPLNGTIPVRCSKCDDVKIWMISVASLVALFEDLDDKTIFEFNRKLLKLNDELLEMSEGNGA